MKLKRLKTSSPAWLLANRYEVHLTYNHGYGLQFIDRKVLIKGTTMGFINGKYEKIKIKRPQEHFYFTGGGVSSLESGLHDVQARKKKYVLPNHSTAENPEAILNIVAKDGN